MQEEIVKHKSQLIPVKAIILYQQVKEFYSRDEYVEVSDFRKTKDGYVLMPGKPISRKSAEDLSRSLTARKGASLRPKPGKPIPANVLYYHGGISPCVVWRLPEGKRQALFSKALPIPSGVMCYPNLVLHVTDHTLYVYASKVKKPKTTENLYALPLPNIHKDGNVCMGSAEVSDDFEFIQDLIQSCEERFFGSVFNTYHEAANNYKINLNMFWNRMTEAESFDYSLFDEVKPTTTLKALLR